MQSYDRCENMHLRWREQCFLDISLFSDLAGFIPAEPPEPRSDVEAVEVDFKKRMFTEISGRKMYKLGFRICSSIRSSRIRWKLDSAIFRTLWPNRFPLIDNKSLNDQLC